MLEKEQVRQELVLDRVLEHRQFCHRHQQELRDRESYREEYVDELCVLDSAFSEDVELLRRMLEG